MVVAGCTRCIKYMLFFFNFVFWVSWSYFTHQFSPLNVCCTLNAFNTTVTHPPGLINKSWLREGFRHCYSFCCPVWFSDAGRVMPFNTVYCFAGLSPGDSWAGMEETWTPGRCVCFITTLVQEIAERHLNTACCSTIFSLYSFPTGIILLETIQNYWKE